MFLSPERREELRALAEERLRPQAIEEATERIRAALVDDWSVFEYDALRLDPGDTWADLEPRLTCILYQQRAYEVWTEIHRRLTPAEQSELLDWVRFPWKHRIARAWSRYLGVRRRAEGLRPKGLRPIG